MERKKVQIFHPPEIEDSTPHAPLFKLDPAGALP